MMPANGPSDLDQGPRPLDYSGDGHSARVGWLPRPFRPRSSRNKKNEEEAQGGMQGLRAEDIALIKDDVPRTDPSAVRRLHAMSRAMIRLAGEGLLLKAGPDIHEQVHNQWAQRIKRVIDVVGALAGILLLSPILITAALAIKLTSEGPVFFAQERLGRNGIWFKALKFRTMYPDAEAKLQELLRNDPALRDEYNRYHKLSRDPRVTSIGRFLRKTSLDELPQLFNVLRGEMSLVGPRAYLPFEVLEMNGTERILQILQVKPGITGFWQVGGRNTVSFEERLDMEVFYVHNWSVGMDLYLLVNTVWVLGFSRGFGAS